MVHRNK